MKMYNFGKNREKKTHYENASKEEGK